MLSSRFANVLPKLRTTYRDSSEKFSKMVSDSDEGTIYGIIGGIGTGCFAVTCTRKDKVEDRVATVSLATVFGTCVGYIAGPLILFTSPLAVPIGLFTVYDNYKHPKQLK